MFLGSQYHLTISDLYLYDALVSVMLETNLVEIMLITLVVKKIPLEGMEFECFYRRRNGLLGT